MVGHEQCWSWSSKGVNTDDSLARDIVLHIRTTEKENNHILPWNLPLPVPQQTPVYLIQVIKETRNSAVAVPFHAEAWPIGNSSGANCGPEIGHGMQV